jgi:glyoxylase-like metal-dependent hydrolase (beta-lactamase superfamily II)
MPFLTEPVPPRGIAQDIRPGIRRIVAANPSVMTYHGTNTYLLDRPEGIVVLDPGPDDPSHVSDVLAATGGKISLILYSHTHHDHVGALPALRAATGAPVAGWHQPVAAMNPDMPLRDHDTITGLTALHTPGHASDHLCFAWTDPAEGIKLLFSADHVMSWSSSIVNPPDGVMADYFTSLLRLLARDDAIYLPGHGPALSEPRALVAEMLAHRRAREAAIAAALSPKTPATVPHLAETLYGKTDPRLHMAAQRNVLAHLLKLQSEGVVTQHGDGWRLL